MIDAYKKLLHCNCKPENKERNLKIYEMRKNEGATFREIGKKFGLSLDRVRMIVCQQENRIAIEEQIKNMPPNLLGALNISFKARFQLDRNIYRDWHIMSVEDFMRKWPFEHVNSWYYSPKGFLEELCGAMANAVGREVVDLWVAGKPIEGEMKL